MKIVCEKCGSTNRRALDSRPGTMTVSRNVKVTATRRRIKCLDCGNRVTTYELTKGQVLGLVEPFVEAKQELDQLKFILGKIQKNDGT